MPETKNYILDQSIAEKKLRRMALEIVENNMDEKNIILAGIRDSGSVVAKCIQQILSEISSLQTEVISISLDKKEPKEVTVSKKIDFTDKVIIVVDDVANSMEGNAHGWTRLTIRRPANAAYEKKDYQQLGRLSVLHVELGARKSPTLESAVAWCAKAPVLN